MNLNFLEPMFADDYYPDSLVLILEQYIVAFAQKIEQKSYSVDEIYAFSHEVIIKINALKGAFSEQDSGLDDIATDYITEAFMMAVQNVGYIDIDANELTINREW